MPNTKSAIKELKKSKKKNAYNKKIKDGLKLSIKKAKKAIESKSAEAEKLVSETLKQIDKAAQKGIIKKNSRDRKKSRLHTKLNQSKK